MGIALSHPQFSQSVSGGLQSLNTNTSFILGLTPNHMDSFEKATATPWMGECEGGCIELLVGFILLVFFLGGMVEFHKDLVGVSEERGIPGRRSTVYPTSPSDLYNPIQAAIAKHHTLGGL